MNKATILLAMLMVCMASAFALPSGFYLDKYTEVSGDWKWSGSNWELGDWTTATYGRTAHSKLATSTFIGQTESLGTAWKYDLEQMIQTDAPVEFENKLHAWTVNDPETTPGESHTKYQFNEQTGGESHSWASMIIKGQGEVVIDSTSHVKTGGYQVIDLDIN